MDNNGIKFEDVIEVGIFISIGVIVVLALSHHLVALSICINALHGQDRPGVLSNLYSFLPTSLQGPADERGNLVQAYMEAQAEELEIKQEGPFMDDRPTPVLLDFSRCNKLKYL
jgi:hypothetical protein